MELRLHVYIIQKAIRTAQKNVSFACTYSIFMWINMIIVRLVKDFVVGRLSSYPDALCCIVYIEMLKIILNSFTVLHMLARQGLYMWTCLCVQISPYMHTCTMHALWAKAYHLLVCECVRRPVFVCAWHLTTIHRSICCGSFHRLGLLSDGGSDAGLISCSLTAPACSWVEPARSCGNFSSSVATFLFKRTVEVRRAKGISVP